MKKLSILLVGISCILSAQAMEDAAKNIFGSIPATETTEGDAFFEKRAGDFITTFATCLDDDNQLRFQNDLKLVKESCEKALCDVADKVVLPENWSGLLPPGEKGKVRHLVWLLGHLSVPQTLMLDFACDLVSCDIVMLRKGFYHWFTANNHYLASKTFGCPLNEKGEFELGKLYVANLQQFIDKLLVVLEQKH